MKNYLKIFSNYRQLSAGFTLIELLIAASLTTVVVGAAGFGLVSILGTNKTANAQIQKRKETDRALKFISDEIRHARQIEDALTADLVTLAPNFDLPSGAQPVLGLAIPKVPERVIYYIAPPPANSVWLGPRVIYRWGPHFNIQGEYTDANNPPAWEREPLVDLIDDTAVTPNCQTGWSPIPSSGASGFFACVDNATGKIAQLYAHGIVNKPFGDSDTYEAISLKS